MGVREKENENEEGKKGKNHQIDCCMDTCAEKFLDCFSGSSIFGELARSSRLH